MAFIGKINIEGTEVPIGSTLFGTCESLASASSKVVNLPGFDHYIDGLTIRVYFKYNNTATDDLLLRINNEEYSQSVLVRPAATFTDLYNWRQESIVAFTYHEYQSGGQTIKGWYVDGIYEKQTGTINDIVEGSNVGEIEYFDIKENTWIPVEVNGVSDLRDDVDTIQGQIGNNTLRTSVPRYDVEFTDHKYTFSEGDTNGTIQILEKYKIPNNTMPEGEESIVHDVPVHGLGSLAYKSSLTASEVGAIATTAKGTANGVAELDSTGKVPASQLPEYVDDIIEGYYYNNKFYKEAAHTTEIAGETGKIYVDLATDKTYRWSGTTFVQTKGDLTLGETSSTAYRGDRGKTAYQHATDSGRLTTAKTEGFYKVGVTAQGHVGSATAVAKSDITALGIPGKDTQYEATTTSVGSASGWNAGSTPTLGTAIPADDITGWNAGTAPSLTINAVACDDITAWNAGTATSLSVSNGVLTITNGTVPSLSYTARSVGSASNWSAGTTPSLEYTAKSIPNVTSVGTNPSLTITSTTVANGIQEKTS